MLIRGVGPSLARLGVVAPLADPYITVYMHGSNTILLYNDDWGQRYDANDIRTIGKQVGAFSLLEGSKDAAYLVELAPGAYTVHLTTYGTTGGTTLLEVYAVP